MLSARESKFKQTAFSTLNNHCSQHSPSGKPTVDRPEPKTNSDSSGLLMLENQSISAPELCLNEDDSADILVANERLGVNNKINTFSTKFGLALRAQVPTQPTQPSIQSSINESYEKENMINMTEISPARKQSSYTGRRGHGT